MVLCGVVGGKRQSPCEARGNECVVSTAAHRQRQWLQSARTLPKEVGLPHRSPRVLLRCYGHGQRAFLSRRAVGQHAQPVVEMWVITPTKRAGWSCRLSPPFCSDVAEAPTSLPWLGYNVMPMGASLVLSLKNDHLFTFPTSSMPHLSPCHSGCVNLVPLRKPSRSGGHQSYNSVSSLTSFPCAANRNLYFSVQISFCNLSTRLSSPVC